MYTLFGKLVVRTFLVINMAKLTFSDIRYIPANESYGEKTRSHFFPQNSDFGIKQYVLTCRTFYTVDPEDNQINRE